MHMPCCTCSSKTDLSIHPAIEQSRLPSADITLLDEGLTGCSSYMTPVLSNRAEQLAWDLHMI